MNLDSRISQRFLDLSNKAQEVAKTQTHYEDYGSGVDSGIFREWSTSVLSLLQRVFSEESPHYKNFHDLYKGFSGNFSDFENCLGVFRAAKDDYEAGHLFSVRGLIKAEDSTDILDNASDLLAAKYKDPACLLAGVALEITLKELCTRNDISLNKPKLETMNAELTKKNVYNQGMQKQITAWAHWRNKAAHGEWNEYKEDDVDSMIKGVTRFVSEYL